MNREWSDIYDKHAPMVRSILYRMGLADELDDLVQECFIKIWKGLKGFRNESNIKTWISRITINTAHDHFRTKGARLVSDEVDFEHLAAVTNEPADIAKDKIVRQALGCLSISHREVLILHVIEENSVDEIADILQISAGTVKSRLFHARTNLKEILRKRGVNYE